MSKVNSLILTVIDVFVHFFLTNVSPDLFVTHQNSGPYINIQG